MKICILIKLFVLFGMLLSMRAEAQSYILDQSFTLPDNEVADINEGFTYVAQTFTVGMSGILMAVAVDISSNNNVTLPLHIQLLDVAGGMPGSVVLGDTVLSSSSSTLSQMIFFPQVIPVIIGSQYAIVASYVGAPPSGAGQSQGYWRGAAGIVDNYMGGGLYASNDEQSWQSPSAQNIFPDQHFQTWVQQVPEPSICMLSVGAGLGVVFSVRRRVFGVA